MGWAGRGWVGWAVGRAVGRTQVSVGVHFHALYSLPVRDTKMYVKRLGKIGSIDPKLQKMKKGPSALLAALKLFACF